MRRNHSNQSKNLNSSYDSQYSFPGYDMESYPGHPEYSRNMIRTQTDLHFNSQKRGTGFRPDESNINQNRQPIPLMQLPLVPVYENQLNPYTRGNNQARGEPNRRWNGGQRGNLVPNQRQMYRGGMAEQEVPVNDLDYNQAYGGHSIPTNMISQQISGGSNIVMNIHHYHPPPLPEHPRNSQHDEWVELQARDLTENKNQRKKGNRKQKMSDINPNPSLSNAFEDENDIEESSNDSHVGFNPHGLFQLDENTSGRGNRRGSRRGSRTSSSSRGGLQQPLSLGRDNNMLRSTESLISNESESRGQHGRRHSRRGSGTSYSASYSASYYSQEHFDLVGGTETLPSNGSLNAIEDEKKGQRGRRHSGRGSGPNRGRRGSAQSPMINENTSQFDSETMGQQDAGDDSSVFCGEFDQQPSSQMNTYASRRGRGPRRGFPSNRSRRGRTASATMSSDVDAETIDQYNEQDDLPSFQEHSLINFDSYRAVDYLLNIHNGSCNITEFKMKCGIFPEDASIESMIYSFKHIYAKLFLVFENPAHIDRSVVKVCSAMRTCRGYSSKKGCKNKKCPYLHLCRDYIAKCCFSNNCQLSHSFADEYNVTVLNKHNLIDFSESQLFDLLRCSSIFVCSEHDSGVGCPDGDSCCNMHVCKEYILGRCLLPNETCGRGHDVKSSHNSRILRVHKMLDWDEPTIVGNILVTKERRKEFKTPAGESDNEYSSNTTKRTPRAKGHKGNSSALSETKVSRNSLVDPISEDFVFSSVNDPYESDTKTVPHGLSEDVKEEQVFSPAMASVMRSTKRQESTMELASSVKNITDQIRAFNSKLEPLVVPVSGGAVEDSEKLNVTSTRNSMQATVQDSIAEVKKELVTAALDDSVGITANSTASVDTSRTYKAINEDLIKQSLSAVKALATSSQIRSDICDVFEVHECFNDEFCRKRHNDLPYLWRIKMGDQWMPLDDLNDVIEREFGDPGCNKKSFKWKQDKKLTITFEPVPMTSNFGDIQRLSTPSYVNVDYREKIDATHWQWYFNGGNSVTPCWILYGEDNQPPYQDVLEAKFLQSSNQICCFELGEYHYDLDFSSMTQTNMKTKAERSVQRRPVFVDSVNSLAVGRLNRVFHFDESKLPKTVRWSPMDTETPLGTELVPLLSNSPQDVEVRGMFHSTLPGKDFTIKRIYRLQNIDLWNSYEIKKERIEKQKRENHLPWRSLFHGTGDFDTVRSICAQGFDQRLHGVNGTVHGKGAYFATTAKYSHSYTKSSPDHHCSRYMFFVRVMIGQCTLGDSEYKRPPPIDPKQPKLGLYDTCVNDLNNPAIFVIFDNHQVYPEYLIEYYKIEDHVEVEAALRRAATLRMEAEAARRRALLMEAEAARRRATTTLLTTQSHLSNVSPAVSTYAPPPAHTSPLRSILRNPSVTSSYSSYSSATTPSNSSYSNYSSVPPPNQAQTTPQPTTQHFPPTTSPPTISTLSPATTVAPSAPTESKCIMM